MRSRQYSACQPVPFVAASSPPVTVCQMNGVAARIAVRFLLNLVCFAACIDGLYFYGAFAHVYFLRSRGLLNGLASGTNWVFRDESLHMDFAFDVVHTVRAEEPDLVDDAFEGQVREMMADAVSAEVAFAQDLLAGMTVTDMRAYLEHVADRRLAQLGFAPMYESSNPFGSWNYRKSRGCRTSSNARWRPTRGRWWER